MAHNDNRAIGVPNQLPCIGVLSRWRRIEDNEGEGPPDCVEEISGLTRSKEAGGVAVAGTHAPPFRTLTDSEFRSELARIQAAAPDVVSIGIRMPKQEMWMARAGGALPGVSLVGVGAVFDWVAGNVRRAPAWMQRSGLEWLDRIYSEPRRLWRRYLWNSPAYLGLVAA